MKTNLLVLLYKCRLCANLFEVDEQGRHWSMRVGADPFTVGYQEVISKVEGRLPHALVFAPHICESGAETLITIQSPISSRVEGGSHGPYGIGDLCGFRVAEIEDEPA